MAASQDFVGGGIGGVPVSKVELSVSGRNLMDMDVFSKSDPICVMYIKEFGQTTFKEFGRTEIIWDNLNPDWVRKFIVDYYFEERQLIKFELFDVDADTRDLSKHDFLGEAEFTLGEIVTSTKLEKNLTESSGKKVKRGKIIVSAEELSSSKEEVTLEFVGEKLDKKDFFGKSDPFLQISRVNEDSSFTVVHRTEVKKVTLNPKWARFTKPSVALCNGDMDRSLKFEVLDWNKSGSHSYIGEFTTTLRHLSRGVSQSTVFQVMNRTKQEKKGSKYKHSGLIQLTYVKVEPVFSFLDYIRGGTELNCTIAIDFTASNGNPTQSNSLHYINSSQPNQYSTALRAVGEIIRDYDTDKLFPVLGFGAKLPPDGRVSHEFFVNLHPSNPYCQDLDGVLQAYERCLRSVQLYGPTNFAPCINHVASFAKSSSGGSDYFILLIITDGVITDMPQTKEAIVRAAGLPLSIIIVGVGDADFDAMEELDGDEVRVSSNGVAAERDIVQFVALRDFLRQRGGLQSEETKARLAKEVLAEIPDQFVSYMKSKRIAPRQGRRQ